MKYLEEISIYTTSNDRKWEDSDAKTWKEIEANEVACCTVGLDKEENLTYECYPSGSYEWIIGDEYEISDQVRDGDDEVDS